MTDKQALREELSNPAIGNRDHLRKLALALLDETEAAERERDNWRTSFDNERFRADKLAEAFKTEHEQLVMANGALITQHIRANRAESSIVLLEAEKSALRRALNNLAAVARRYLPDYDEHPDIQAADDLLESAAGIDKVGQV